MSVTETARGTWQVRWRDIDGRQRARTFPTRTAARAWERAVLVDTDRGLHTGQPTRMSVAAWADQWLASAHNLRPKTRQIYRETIRRFCAELGHVELGRLTTGDIDRWLTARTAAGAAHSSVHRDHRVIRRMMRVAHDRGHILADPTAKVAAPRVPAIEMRFLTAAQLERLADVIDARYRGVILVAGWGGLRWGEIAALRVGDVDLAAGRVHVHSQLSPDGRARTEPKTAAGRRWITLPRSVTADLAPAATGRDADAPLWPMPAGGPLVHSRWQGTAGRRRPDGTWAVHPRGYWRRAVAAARLEPLRFHDLRHTSVALAVAAGMHPRVIQARLGHASIETTLGIYGHVFDGLDDAAAVDLDVLRSTTFNAGPHRGGGPQGGSTED